MEEHSLQRRPVAPDEPGARAQSEIDYLYGTGKIDRAYWSNAYENLSRMICKDYRCAISPDLCSPPSTVARK